ncbi:MAG: DUF3343 domain-containing protein [Firmicutes bacterium]|nr:DUF3343 domain-containing protein [Bacillota bacterium]
MPLPNRKENAVRLSRSCRYIQKIKASLIAVSEGVERELQGGYKVEKEYIMAFSSFYKAAYGRDVLAEAGIKSSLRKLPVQLIKSCSTGLYLRTDSIQSAIEIFQRKQIAPVGVYEIQKQGRGKRNYEQIK